jgi:serine protease inhibitor
MKTPQLLASGVVLALVSACFVGSCSSPANSPDKPAPAQVRALSTQEQTVARANGDFAVRLFQEISRIEGSKNTFVSPLSYMQALAMTTNGASGSTRDSMVNALQLQGSSLADINTGTRTLTDYLLGLDPNVEFRIANGIWHNQAFTIEQPFLSTVRESYTSEIRGMAFGKDRVKDDINAWVEQKTNNRIKNLIQEEFTADDVMCLVNAVYFNALWKARFDVADTKDEPFKRENGTTLNCKMMNLTKPTDVRVSFLPNAQLVEIPYSNGQFSMTIVLPNTGQRLADVIAGLTPVTWKQATDRMSSTATMIAMPKFSMTTRYEDTRDRPGALQALGFGSAFARNADFSGMVRPPLRAAISSVVHQTFLKVDEVGTEAAAATAVTIRALSNAIPQPAIIRFDRPFAFFIREKSSNVILFVGSLYEPQL